MGQENLAPSPPKTEVLSVEEVQLTPEEVLELGKEQVETKEVPEPKPETIKPETEEVSPELEEGEEEVTHDPLKDTKAELTRTQQRLAKLERITTAAVADKQFREPPTAQEMFKLPPRPIMPQPAEGDDGITYTQKVAQVIEQQKTYDDIVSDYESFVAEHPDWLDIQSEMQRVSRRFPELMYGRRAMHKVYDIAIMLTERQAIQDARKDELAEASATGAKIEREKVRAGSAFIKPGSATKSKPSLPDFAKMSIEQIDKWIEDNPEKAKSSGLIR